MALTREQEDVLGRFADQLIAEQAYQAKVAELKIARVAAEAKIPPLPKASTKADILTYQAQIAADPEVARLTDEAAALKPLEVKG